MIYVWVKKHSSFVLTPHLCVMIDLSIYNPLKHRGIIGTACFAIQKHCVLHMCLVILRMRSSCFPQQHQRAGVYDGDEEHFL